MNVAKYASLPDIDTAPDVYETEDVFPTTSDPKGESSDDEPGVSSRTHGRRNGEPSGKEELDLTSIDTEGANKRFRKAEKKHHRPRIQYTYPESPTSPSSPSSPTAPAVPLSQRLRLLQNELAALETELADPSNPLLKQEKDVEPGELIRGMVDVKGRLDKISKLKEGRGKLVSVVLGEGGKTEVIDDHPRADRSKMESEDGVMVEAEGTAKSPDVKDIADMDRRVGDLEKVVGSTTTALDELSPLPPPLLPLLTRLNSQITLLTQPRHLDSISRRLKLLLSDLERVSSANAQQHGGQRRQANHPHGASISAASQHHGAPAAAPAPASGVDQLTPVLTRLMPLLPHIPHILTRLRTLSQLHTQAAAFQTTLDGLEEEQRKVHAALEELERALHGVEQSIKDNENVVKTNVKEIEDRVENVGRRIEELHIKS